MKKLTPRAKFIATADEKRVRQLLWDTTQQASSHDPEHAKELIRLEKLIYAEVKLQDRRFADTCSRLVVIERQLERMGAPQYRLIRKGKS